MNFMLVYVVIIFNIFEVMCDCNPSWRANNGQSCATFHSRQYCRSDGRLGWGWQSRWGTFQDFMNADKETALFCPQCGCVNWEQFYLRGEWNVYRYKAVRRRGDVTLRGVPLTYCINQCEMTEYCTIAQYYNRQSGTYDYNTCKMFLGSSVSEVTTEGDLLYTDYSDIYESKLRTSDCPKGTILCLGECTHGFITITNENGCTDCICKKYRDEESKEYVPYCRDYHNGDCQHWRNRGFCEPNHQHYSLARSKCPMSCGTCGYGVCPSPIKPSSGKVELRNEYENGSVVTYTCDPGHVLKGVENRTCEAEVGFTGSWTGEPPHCEPVKCPEPCPMINGVQTLFLKERGYAYANKLTTECDDGFIRHGERLVRCDSDGTWSSPPATCEEPAVCTESRDVIILCEESEMMGAFYPPLAELLGRILSSLQPASPPEPRISLITFGTIISHRWQMSVHNVTSLKSAVTSMPNPEAITSQGVRRVALALRTAATTVSSGGREDVPKMVLLVTTGNPTTLRQPTVNNWDTVADRATQLHESADLLPILIQTKNESIATDFYRERVSNVGAVVLSKFDEYDDNLMGQAASHIVEKICESKVRD